MEKHISIKNKLTGHTLRGEKSVIEQFMSLHPGYSITSKKVSKRSENNLKNLNAGK